MHLPRAASELARLRAHLARHRALPQPWVTAEDPGRELRRLWAACEEPWVLLELAEPVAGRPRVVLAAVDCVRLAIAATADPDPTLAAAMDVVEGWARGECTDAQVDEAQDRIGEVIERQECAPAIGYACFYVAQVARSGCWAQHDDPDAFRALSHAADCLGEGGLSRLCDRVRACLECPTLAELLAAYGAS